MKQVIDFMRALAANNNREWFQAHKDEYMQVKAKVDHLAEELIAEISQYDETIAGLKPSDCTYRIYRDLRFHKDRGPYKEHIGIYVCRGGKKSGYSGYYFHISAFQSDEVPNSQLYTMSHMLAVGDYCCDPKALKVLREDIEMGNGEFESTLEAADKRFFLDMTNSLKKVPKDFPADSPHGDYLKLKNYCLCASIDDKFITDPGLAKRLAKVFSTGKPFLDFINRGIEFARGE